MVCSLRADRFPLGVYLVKRFVDRYLAARLASAGALEFCALGCESSLPPPSASPPPSSFLLPPLSPPPPSNHHPGQPRARPDPRQTLPANPSPGAFQTTVSWRGSASPCLQWRGLELRWPRRLLCLPGLLMAVAVNSCLASASPQRILDQSSSDSLYLVGLGGGRNKSFRF